MVAIISALTAPFLSPAGGVAMEQLHPWWNKPARLRPREEKEIVLTGVNIGDFGKTTGETFFNLVKALDEVEGIERYRISSIEPNLLTDEIIEFVSHSPQFHASFPYSVAVR